jgi:lauroyl/myristoyl acyltransferase
MYEHTARFWTEALFLPRLLRPTSWRRRFRFSGDLSPDDLGARVGGGAVLATCYFGNIAAAAFALGEICRPVYVVVDYLAQPAARAWQDQLYRARNVRPLPVERSAARVPDVLARGEKVLLVVEHRRARGGADATFLGETGGFQTTIGRLASWYGVPVVPVLCRRLSGWAQFELWLGSPVRGTDVEEVTAATLRQLDAQVRRWPEQYLWSMRPATAPQSLDALIETEIEKPAAPTTR